jgi:hypothetical protein
MTRRGQDAKPRIPADGRIVDNLPVLGEHLCHLFSLVCRSCRLFVPEYHLATHLEE